MEETFISETEFENEWKVFMRPNGDLFDHEDIKDHHINHVWTIVESGSDEDGNWYASPGLHYVNRIGYVMTEKPWTDELRDAIYFLDDFDHEEDSFDD